MPAFCKVELSLRCTCMLSNFKSNALLACVGFGGVGYGHKVWVEGASTGAGCGLGVRIEGAGHGLRVRLRVRGEVQMQGGG